MRSVLWLGGGLAALCVAASGSIPGTKSGSTPSPKPGSPIVASDGSIEAMGRTQCVAGRRASIAPVPLHPVVDVLVVQGEHVKKGQILVKLDDDEARADVRLKQALLEGAHSTANEARRFLSKARSKQEILPEQRLHEAELAVLKAEAEQRAAQATLNSSQAELEHFSVAAAIDGIVSWLDVQPGVVSRPGTSVCGEIVDLRELDVKCELTPQQADDVALGQPVEVWGPDREGAPSIGRLIFIASVADRKSGLVPVLVRLRNSEQRLRCGVSVSVRFPPGPGR
ncbi:MAG TPA: efflux RND transporter periplasmic adaptor subunit [Planctomycetaceae bacterium]|nr:efflux RND transporter periplasmic adaptor subunit [Planctomycetaceae bacterium]